MAPASPTPLLPGLPGPPLPVRTTGCRCGLRRREGVTNGVARYDYGGRNGYGGLERTKSRRRRASALSDTCGVAGGGPGYVAPLVLGLAPESAAMVVCGRTCDSCGRGAGVTAGVAEGPAPPSETPKPHCTSAASGAWSVSRWCSCWCCSRLPCIGDWCTAEGIVLPLPGGWAILLAAGSLFPNCGLFSACSVPGMYCDR